VKETAAGITDAHGRVEEHDERHRQAHIRDQRRARYRQKVGSEPPALCDRSRARARPLRRAPDRHPDRLRARSRAITAPRVTAFRAQRPDALGAPETS
jgi:hypothetical protein